MAFLFTSVSFFPLFCLSFILLLLVLLPLVLCLMRAPRRSAELLGEGVQVEIGVGVPKVPAERNFLPNIPFICFINNLMCIQVVDGVGVHYQLLYEYG